MILIYNSFVTTQFFHMIGGGCYFQVRNQESFRVEEGDPNLGALIAPQYCRRWAVIATVPLK